jgi:hypothetical protein
MSKLLERRVCVCDKEYLFGGVYQEPVCPGCLPAHKGFVRTQEQEQRLLRAWRSSLEPEGREQEATAA